MLLILVCHGGTIGRAPFGVAHKKRPAREARGVVEI
jgi:hypothetical protein